MHRSDSVPRPSRRELLRVLGGSALILGVPMLADTRVPLGDRLAADPDLNRVLAMARKLLASGLSAGSGYPEVWIRDTNNFLEAALPVNDPQLFRTAFHNFFLLQGPEGDIVDGYVVDQHLQEPAYRKSPALPGYVAHKNTVETDQESSLVLAVARYVRLTGDAAFLRENVEGLSVRDRLERALRYPLAGRSDPRTGLLWGGATIDWGDVAPERIPSTKLFPETHRAIGIYHNALFACAIRDFLALPDTRPEVKAHWQPILDDLKTGIRRHLWQAGRQQYRPHLYLDGSPFPPSFNESALYLHGGTAVAIEADLHSRAEVQAALTRMRRNVRDAHASSIGLTLYPTYPAGFYADPIVAQPYTYQNGGDWCWFGRRMVQQMIRFGMLEDAYLELKPMLARVARTGDFHEWWTPDNQPRGSGSFRGSAGVLGTAITMLQGAAGVPSPAPRGMAPASRPA